MRRVSVVGCSGSGKSTLARRLAETLDVPYVELDDLHYQGKLGGLVWEQADTVVWVNPPKHAVMWRSLTRTLRQVLAPGTVERQT